MSFFASLKSVSAIASSRVGGSAYAGDAAAIDTTHAPRPIASVAARARARGLACLGACLFTGIQDMLDLDIRALGGGDNRRTRDGFGGRGRRCGRTRRRGG